MLRVCVDIGVGVGNRLDGSGSAHISLLLFSCIEREDGLVCAVRFVR